MDLDAFQPEQFLNAMIASFKGDELPLTTIIEALTIKDL